MATRKSELIITCNAKGVENVMRILDERLKGIKQQLQTLNNYGSKHGWTDDMKKDFKELSDEAAGIDTIMKRNQETMRKYGEVIKDLAGAKLKDLKKALQEGKNALNNMSARDPRREQLVRDLQRIKAQIDTNTGAVQKNTSAWGALGTTLKNLVAYAGVFAMFNKMKSLLGEMVTKNKEFSDQLANVRKVSNLAMEDIDKLAVSLSKIDSRTSLKGLMELSYTGAKLGYGNYGIEGLESFAKSAVKVQNALSEDMGADSMTALSKMVEVMGLIPKMGVQKAMDATGSAIFKLASTSTATGTNIVEFSKRLMGLANIAHITTPELLAIGSAADSMALMPEVAATAFNKLITAVQKQPNLIENALKIDQGTISDLFQAGKMTDALVLIFEKMREKGGMNALMQSGVFKDLGSDGARLVAVMATMANRVDMLNAHLAVSRQAFEEGTAVAQEYAIQMDTAAAYSERAANIWEKAFVNPEGVNVVKDLSKAWYEVSKSLTENEKIMFGIKVTLQGIILLLKTILTILPEIIFTLGIAGMASMIARMREGEGLLASLTAWFGRLSAAQKVFFKAAGWVGLAITILEVGKAIYDMANKTKEAAIYMKDFDTSLSDLNTELGKSESELRRYRKAIDEANVGSKQRLAAINTFNSKFSPYLKNLLTERSTAQDVANAYNEITKAMRAKLALQLKEKDIQNEVMPREQWTAERRTEYDKRAREAGYGQYGSTWITGYAQDNAAKSIDDMIRDIGKRFYNLPNVIIDEVAKQAKAGNTDFNNYGNIINSRYLGAANALLGANAYLRQDRSAQNAMRRVNQKWAPEQAAMDAYTAANQQQDVIEPLTPAPDKDELKKQQKAMQEYKQALRKELQDAQRESDAIISKIEEWYRLQETVITGYAADGIWTQEKADQMLAQLNIAKNKALADARRGISGRDEQTWETTKQQIGQLMFDTSDMSKNLLEAIMQVKLENVRTALGKIDSAGIEGISSTAMRDKLNKNAAGNDREVERIMRKASKEVEQMLLQYDFLEQAIRAFDTRLEKLGLLTESAAAASQRIRSRAGTTEEVNAAEAEYNAQRRKAKESAALQFVANGTQNMSVNYNDTDELRSWLADFAGYWQTMGRDDHGNYVPQSGFSKWAEVFKEDFELWIKDTDKYKQDIQAFYLSLVNAEEVYYKKRKESYNFEKQQQEQYNRATGLTDAEDQQTTALSNRAKQQDAGIGASFWQQQGLGSIKDDPEVQMIQTRIYYRNLDVEYARKHLEQMQEMQAQEIEMMQQRNATEEELEQKREEHRLARMGLEDLLKERQSELFEQETMLATKVSQELQKRVQTINTLTKPITDFTQAAGRKIGDMIFNMESEEATWEELWKNMALAVGESVIQMGAQYAQNLLMQKAMNSASESEAVADAGVKVSAGIAAGSAKTIGELGWWGIPLIGIISSLLMGLLQSALSTKSNKDGSSSSSASSSNTRMRLVSGMLTYDEGNIGTYQGSDGQSYRATAVSAPADGLVTRPIATTVQGQPALVAERGPEIVIGRRTTRAIMMNEPGLIKYLANYGRGAQAQGRYRAYDEGNLSDYTQLPDGSAAAQPAAGITADDAKALVAAIGAFNETVNQMQQKGIPCYINKYGTGGLIEEVKSGMKFDAKYNG